MTNQMGNQRNLFDTNTHSVSLCRRSFVTAECDGNLMTSKNIAQTARRKKTFINQIFRNGSTAEQGYA